MESTATDQNGGVDVAGIETRAGEFAQRLFASQQQGGTDAMLVEARATAVQVLTDTERLRADLELAMEANRRLSERNRLIEDLHVNQAATISSQAQRIEELLAEANQGRIAEQHWRRKHDDLLARLYREADDRAWCEDFDNIMEEMGYDRREKEFEVNVTATVTVTYSRTVTATSFDDAKEAVEEDEDDIVERLHRGRGYFDVDGTSIDSVERAD